MSRLYGMVIKTVLLVLLFQIFVSAFFPATSDATRHARILSYCIPHTPHDAPVLIKEKEAETDEEISSPSPFHQGNFSEHNLNLCRIHTDLDGQLSVLNLRHSPVVFRPLVI